MLNDYSLAESGPLVPSKSCSKYGWRKVLEGSGVLEPIVLYFADTICCSPSVLNEYTIVLAILLNSCLITTVLILGMLVAT